MASIPESAVYRHEFDPSHAQAAHFSSWLRVGFVAAASAVAGGVAAAWYYRKTLARLRQAEGLGAEAPFGVSAHDEGDDF